MRLFVSIAVDVDGEFDPLAVLEAASITVKTKWHVNNEYTYIHDGKGNAYQSNRRCDCGSHFFKDVPWDKDRDLLIPEEHFVACMKCGKTYPVQ
jgi:hypothetical protein